MELTAAILAGGKSRRLGRDKALMRVGSRTLLEIVAEIALESLASVWVVGRQKPVGWSLEPVAFLPDDQPDQGPMGGLATALRNIHTPLLLLGCDMPALQVETTRWLVDIDRETAARDGLISINNNRMEPLFSIYRPTVLPTVERCLDQGRYSLLAVIDDGEFGRASVPPNLSARFRWRQYAEPQAYRV